MKMTQLADLLLMTAEVHGDRDVVFAEEGTGEIRYVAGLSFDPDGGDVMLEHLGYEDMTLAAQLEELEKRFTDEQIAMAILENIMKEVFG